MKTHVNLQCEPLRIRRALQTRLIGWLVVLIVTAGVMGGIAWHDRGIVHELASRRAALEREYAPLKKIRGEIKRLQLERDTLHQREQLALRLAEPGPVLSLLGLVSQAAGESGGNVYVSDFTFAGRSPVSPPGNRGNQAWPEQTLTLQGVGTDNLSIARFAAAIRDSNLFGSVQLEAAEEVRREERTARSYHLNCALRDATHVTTAEDTQHRG